MIMNVVKAVLTKAPGEGIIHNENMPSIMSVRYCPS